MIVAFRSAKVASYGDTFTEKKTTIIVMRPYLDLKESSRSPHHRSRFSSLAFDSFSVVLLFRKVVDRPDEHDLLPDEDG